MDIIRQCLSSCTMQYPQLPTWLLWEPLRASRGSQEAPAAIQQEHFFAGRGHFVFGQISGSFSPGQGGKKMCVQLHFAALNGIQCE
jgi:hypothetical protein